MTPEPIYTYAAVGFIVGVVVGIGCCRALLVAANRMLAKANQEMDEAKRILNRALGYYEAITRQDERQS